MIQINEIKKFLIKLDLFFVCENDSIKVSRDSVIKNIKAIYEEDSQQRLIARLNDFFETRFYYSCIDNNWLWIKEL
jgi:hypothetical protein